MFGFLRNLGAIVSSFVLLARHFVYCIVAGEAWGESAGTDKILFRPVTMPRTGTTVSEYYPLRRCPCPDKVIRFLLLHQKHSRPQSSTLFRFLGADQKESGLWRRNFTIVETSARARVEQGTGTSLNGASVSHVTRQFK